jgi:membrane fusion protein (multidrug efflux system)
VGDYYGDKDIVIATGLKAGDRVIVDGMLKVVPGQPVQITGAGPTGAQPEAVAAQPGPQSGESAK